MEMITTIDERMSERASSEAAMPNHPTALTGERELRKRVWSLAGPVIGENFLETLWTWPHDTCHPWEEISSQRAAIVLHSFVTPHPHRWAFA